jgi:hypothetical protein
MQQYATRRECLPARRGSTHRRSRRTPNISPRRLLNAHSSIQAITSVTRGQGYTPQSERARGDGDVEPPFLWVCAFWKYNSGAAIGFESVSYLIAGANEISPCQ